MSIDIEDPQIFRLYLQEKSRNDERVERPATSEERADARAWSDGSHMWSRRPLDE